MRALRGLIRKEFLQIFRDINMIRLIFVMPIIQLFMFGYVVNTDVKQLALDVYDLDQSMASRQLIQGLSANDYFVPTPSPIPLTNAPDRFRDGSAELALIIPPDFSESLAVRHPVTIGLLADGSNANSSALGQGYFHRSVQQFTERVIGLEPPLTLNTSILYNLEGESVYFMVPGIVATLLTMITVMLTSMAIVREREVGTLEQLLVTPIGKWTLLAGKLIPFAVLGMLAMGIALTLGTLWFRIPFVGSPLLLCVLALLYLFSTLGLGLYFSTVTRTQQQAMFFAWFFSIFAMLTSGLFTPVSNMPTWLQYLTLLNPMRFFLEAVRGIMMKGAGIQDLLSQIMALLLFGPIIFSIAALRFRKQSA